MGSTSPISASVWDLIASTPINIQMSIGVSGFIGMPDRSYYLEDTGALSKTILKHTWQRHGTNTESHKVEKRSRKAQQILSSWDPNLQTFNWPREKRRNRDLSLNQITGETCRGRYPNFD